MQSGLEKLGELYGSWWIDFLGEHNHVWGVEATRWLASRAQLKTGARVLDAGAFVGATARLLSTEFGAGAVATDANPDFLLAGRELEGGANVAWVSAVTQRLPFAAGVFDSVWCLDSFLSPRELSRVAAPTATLCLSCETPEDGRGGAEAFVDEWREHGWQLAAHRPTTLEAVHAWQVAESALVSRRSIYEPRYGKRSYLRQLDQVAELVRSYSMHEQGHGLYVFRRGG